VGWTYTYHGYRRSALIGVIVFFYGETLTSSDWVGIIITFISGIGWALYMIYSRSYLRSRKDRDVVVLSVHSMLYGSSMLMALAGLKGELIYPSIDVWIVILWLAVVNTPIAFVLWNHALQWLQAYEQSILQNTMLIQITLLAYVFLGERLSIMNIIGMALVFIGVLIVELWVGNFDSQRKEDEAKSKLSISSKGISGLIAIYRRVPH
jgi:drug/metabolite transporter (DMT)-like permease